MPKDFLSNLALRAFPENGAEHDATGSLQPRRASLYEPSAARLTPTMVNPFEEEAVEVDRQLTVRSRPVILPPSPENPESHPNPLLQSRETVLGPAPKRQVEPPETLQAIPAPTPRIIEPVRSERFTEALTPEPLPSETFPTPRTSPEPSSIIQQEFKPMGGEMDVRSTSDLLPDSLSVSRPLLAPTERAPEENLLPPKAAILAPETESLKENSAKDRIIPEKIVITSQEIPPPSRAGDQRDLIPINSTPEQKPSSAAQLTVQQPALQPPTIHVTIGRIEVKASSTPSTPKAASPKPATMSLDEYIRRRQGGSR